MEYLVINESKLKIIMTSEDARSYGLSTLGADYDSPEARRCFWRVLDDAASAVGFSARGDKVLIQFYPSRDGGCEIFVTKLGALRYSDSRAISHSENVTTLSLLPDVFRFDSQDALARALSLMGKDHLGTAEVRWGKGDARFLLVELRDVDRRCRLILSEFAVPVPRELISFVREHLTHVATGENIYDKPRDTEP